MSTAAEERPTPVRAVCVWVEGHSGTLRENYKFAFFCNPCGEKWLYCHYCRCVPWATPPVNDGDPTNGYLEKKARAAEDEKTKPREQ